MIRKQYTLGISAFYHDSAAALLCNGEVVAAAHEERFTRKKHDEAFPKNAIIFCLQEAEITLEQIDAVVFYDKPFVKFERILKTSLKTWPFGFLQFIRAIPVWLHKKLFLRTAISKVLDNFDSDKIYFAEHHISHAASSVFVAPFVQKGEDTAFLVVDGVGEFATTTIGQYKNNKFEVLEEIEFPDSLGLLYSTITGFLGFKVNSAEYKVMGLAPYGKDRFAKEVRELVTIFEDGSFALNMKYFSFEGSLRMHSSAMEKLFKMKTRKSESKLTQEHFDIAHSLQKLTEEIFLGLARRAKDITGLENLCLSGGVALNCVANGKLLESNLFKNIFIQPAAGDAGGALGAALYYHYRRQDHNTYCVKEPCDFFSPYLGPEYSDAEIQEVLENDDVKFSQFSSDAECCNEVAKLINGENVIGWFQGKAEFGPRSLGNRSIIADARNKENWKKVNLKIKFREDFRPFAPSVLEERMSEYFNLATESPYMLLVADVKTQDLPAVTHVDNSARIQSVNKNQNEKYYNLLKAFEAETGCGAVINTSFNVRSEPIVLTAEHALNGFLHTEMDYLVLNNFLVSKKENLHLISEDLKEQHLKSFELD